MPFYEAEKKCQEEYQGQLARIDNKMFNKVLDAVFKDPCDFVPPKLVLNANLLIKTRMVSNF